MHSVGLANLGNTCFLNSCIQILNQTKELNTLMKTKKYNNAVDAVIVREWLELHELMNTSEGIISPNKFVYHVQELAKAKDKNIFSGWSQNDLPEFLLFMIECFHNSIKRKVKMKISGNEKTEKDKVAVCCYQMLQHVFENEYSEILEMFYAIYVSEIISLDGSTIHTMKPEMFFILDLPIPIQQFDNNTSVTLYDCFEEYLRPEVLDGDNAWFNETTNQKEGIKKQIVFWNLPKILVIMLKRISNFDQKKMNQLVDFPITDLNLSKYVSGYNSLKYVYDLFGVCYHYGGMHGGHYTCSVLNQSQKWLYINDTHVEEIEDIEQIVKPHSYCLFYRMR